MKTNKNRMVHAAVNEDREKLDRLYSCKWRLSKTGSCVLLTLKIVIFAAVRGYNLQIAWWFFGFSFSKWQGILLISDMQSISLFSRHHTMICLCLLSSYKSNDRSYTPLIFLYYISYRRYSGHNGKSCKHRQLSSKALVVVHCQYEY